MFKNFIISSLLGKGKQEKEEVINLEWKSFTFVN